MADLNIITKYETDRRIDHVDFGDVYKTTFGKGTIIDFEKISDDPIVVKSRVKVQGDWGESDFIPLFYKPKSQYWDEKDDDGKVIVAATDFNQKQKYFEKAWMSFRGGDEVKVMMREGVPLAVLAFADSKPRIGEDIIKIEFPLYASSGHFCHLRCSDQSLYGELDEAKKGPDNIELGLTEGNSFSWYGGLYYKPPYSGYPNTTGGQANYCQRTGYSGDCGAQRHAWDQKQHYHEFFVTVGPILYIFQIQWTESWQYLGNVVIISYDEWQNQCFSEGAIMLLYNMHDGGPLIETNSIILNFIICRAGIYTPELLQAIQDEGGISTEEAYNNFVGHPIGPYEWGTEYEDTYLQTTFYLASLIHDVCPSYGNKPKWDEALFYVRPHTTEELAGAGA